MSERRDLMEISPYQADEGELIGKHPGDVPPDFLSLKFRAQNPLKAIREKCLDCCCGNAAEVRKCVAVDCPLWSFRIGTNPFRKKRELAPAEKHERAKRLQRAKGGFAE
jgi:hypothetical protein